jgi:hypothetical protein
MNLFDRYITRNFLQAYLYCIIGFISIWFIFDISDSISTFLDQHVGFWPSAGILRHPNPADSGDSPASLPSPGPAFCSRADVAANEIVSMLTAGIGLIRVLTPLFLLAIITTAVCFALNYTMAPHAEMARKLFFADKTATGAEGQIFRNRRDSRTWFIQRLNPIPKSLIMSKYCNRIPPTTSRRLFWPRTRNFNRAKRPGRSRRRKLYTTIRLVTLFRTNRTQPGRSGIGAKRPTDCVVPTCAPNS